MIFWKDFILDDVAGAILAMPDEDLTSSQSCREAKRLGGPNTRNGASGINKAHSALIQETRQEQRPARMGGHSSHDSAQVDRMSVGSNRAIETSRLVGGEE